MVYNMNSKMTGGGQMDPDEKVYIIVLNWNGWQDTVECLESLLRLAYRN